jgi:hypothetical protein
LVARYPKVLLRKVDIVSWESDAWKQASSEFKSRGIPLLAVFDGKGVFHGTVPAHPPLIEQAVAKALAQ